ncbi:MAG TPA: glycosyltransferase family 4 protein, partial [Planctomycetaceae bacterium]
GGGAVHCVVNDWENHRIVDLAERIGASWSAGFHRYLLARSRNPLSLLKTAARVARTSAGFLRTAARFRPTHVLLPEYGAVAKNFPALLWLRARGVTTVLRLGNAPPRGRFYTQFFRRAVDPAVSRYVCTSEYVRGELLRHGVSRRKTCVIYNALHVDRRPSDGTERPERQANRLIYVGQIIPEKNVHVLLDAVGLLRRRGADVTLDVVGPMEGWVPEGHKGYRERLLERAEVPDLAGRVRFHGRRSDVIDLMASASLHVAPSSEEMGEGCPNVVLEAKSAGLPTVAFALGPYPELIAHGETGWLCRGIDPEALADGIAAMLSDPERLRRSGEAARRSLRDYGWDRFAARWAAVFAERGIPSADRPLTTDEEH